MKKLRFAIASLLLTVLCLLSFSNFSTRSVTASLEFVPMVSVAPDDNSVPAQGSGAYACSVPANAALGTPAYLSRFYHCYTPTEMEAAYGVDKLHASGITGKGQTIVIVDSYGSPTALNDLQVFSRYFGLPDPDLTIYYPNGKPTYNTTSPKDPQNGWAFETSLDLQWAHATAPDAKIVLIAANPQESEGVQGFPSIFNGISYAVNQYPGAVLSQSFAVTEQSFNGAAQSQVARFDQVYQQAKANKVTVISSAGDSGTANGDKQGNVYPYPTAEWPASSPYVTGAGGTWLQSGWTWNPQESADSFYSCLNAGTSFNTCAASYLSYTNGPTKTEAVWKEDWLPAATGGALSALYSTPDFQSGISQSLLNGHRGVPDFSWNAAVDGGALVYTSFGGTRVGWHPVGGTSASAPQLAGLVTLANQLASDSGKQPVGFLNDKLYKLPASAFHDIVPQTFGTGAGVTTLNSNQEYGSGIAGSATTPGYDLTNGLGSPNAPAFVSDLVALLPNK